MVLIIKCLFRFVVCFMQYAINVDTCVHWHTHTQSHTDTKHAGKHTHALLVW